MDDQSAAGDCTPADRSSSPWQLCWYFCWYSLNQHRDNIKKSLKKSSFIWLLPGPPMNQWLNRRYFTAPLGHRTRNAWLRRSLPSSSARKIMFHVRSDDGLFLSDRRIGGLVARNGLAVVQARERMPRAFSTTAALDGAWTPSR